VVNFFTHPARSPLITESASRKRNRSRSEKISLEK